MIKTKQQLIAPQERKALLLKYLAVISTEMRQMDTPEPLFHGCWDWHSAVHGHLAMLLGSQAMGWKAQMDWMISRLDDEAMDQVFARLEREPHFEQPYGRAWFLYLLTAVHQHISATDRQFHVDALAQDLALWRKPQNLSLGGKDYQEPCFVLSALLAWYEHRDAETQLNYWRSRIEDQIIANPADLNQDSEQPGYFFSRWALQALVIQRALGDQVLKEWLEMHCMQPAEPVTDYHSVHHMGINASRAWGLSAAYQATQADCWLNQSVAHIKAADALHTKWQGDRHAYSHWLPQFTVFAILGGPALH